MKAVIMCGGAGSRLRPITEVTPKPLVKLLNVPILEHIIQRVIGAGYREIYLSLGYKAQEIIDFCERRGFDAEIRYCTEDKPLGTAGGVKNCINRSGESILVLSGDNIFNVDLTKVGEYHRVADADVTLVAREVEDPREYGVILKDEEGNITGFQEKPTWENAQSFLINTGIYFLKGEMLDLIPEGVNYDFSDQLFPEVLHRKLKFMCYHTQDFWGDIGEFEAYRSASGVMLSTFTEEWLYSGTLYREEAEDNNGNRFIAPCLIGENARLGMNNRIGPNCVIGKNAVIASDCVIEDSILGDDTETGSGSDLSGCVTDDCVYIGMNCVVEKNAVLGYGASIGNFTRVLSGGKLWPGKRIPSESVVSHDMFFDSPVSVEPDIYGVSGKAFSQFSLNDALRLGHAIGSVKGVSRVGIGGDGSNTSVIYGEVCSAGMRACGTSCYDFRAVFKSQAFFYSAYCSLDLFLFISVSDDTVNFSFIGKNGLPVAAKTARAINNRFRFSVFDYAAQEKITELFRMQLMNVAYTAFLNSQLTGELHGRRIRVECENPLISDPLKDVLTKRGAAAEPGGLQFLINAYGTEMYCIEDERFYSADRIRMFLSELRLAEGKAVVIGEDAPDALEQKSADYQGEVFRLNDGAGSDRISTELFLENLWNFDAAALAVKIISVLLQSGLTLAQAMETQAEFVLRKRVVDLDCAPAEVRTLIKRTGAVKSGVNSSVYYKIAEKKGTVKLRQLGNASRIKILAEAADMETAKELAGDTLEKIRTVILDNKSFF